MKMCMTVLAAMATGIIFLFFSCNKENLPCRGVTHDDNRNHLVDIQAINKSIPLTDTLAKYPNLQVYRIIDDEFSLGMHCNVYYNNLMVINMGYSLFQSKKDESSLFETRYFPPQEIDLILEPTINIQDALKQAHEQLDFRNSCVKYRLGIYKLKHQTTPTNHEFALVWHITGENKIPYIVSDAHTGYIYMKDDGIRR